MPPEIEQDAADTTAVHVISRDEAGAVVATGRLLLRGSAAVIGRMAADPAARGRGYGAAVLAELHRQAVSGGATEVELHAQVTARGFYERAGYAPSARSTRRPVSRTSRCGEVDDSRGSIAARNERGAGRGAESDRRTPAAVNRARIRRVGGRRARDGCDGSVRWEETRSVRPSA